MSVNKFNSEGYYDPTFYEAITNIEQEEKQKRYRPIVYICSPFRGDVETNIENARRYCRFAVKQGYIPLAPHLFFPQFLDEDAADERELAMFMDLALLSKCRELWVFGSVRSRGMRREIDKANYRRMPVRYFDSDCKEAPI